MLTLLFAATLSQASHAKITTVSTRIETHQNAKFIEYKKEVVLPNPKPGEVSYLTDTRFIVQQASSAQIEDQAVVQWIRGCVFSANAKGEKSADVVREHFRKIIPFRHEHWQIDSDSTDPIYSSYRGAGRFALLRWNSDPKNFDPETATYYAKAKPSHGTTFLTDLPASAFSTKTDSQNVSLEFRTCLFNTVDLPLATDPDGTNIDSAKAQWCVSWDHKFVYDFKSKTMTKPSQIDSFCRQTSL